MKVLLTGASGFIGRYVLAALMRRGVDTVAVGRHAPCEGVNFIEADLLGISDFQSLLHEVKASHLLHLAWYAEHGKYWTSSQNLRWVEATTRLVESFCATGGQHVVAAGTCAEYDWSHGYCREDITPLSPATLYGIAKDAARRLIMVICAQHQVSCAWGRVFLPYGRGEASARLIPSMIEVFQRRRDPFGVNVVAYRDFLQVSDVAEAFVTLLQHGANGEYNISSGQPVQLIEVVRELARIVGGNPEAILRLTTQRSGESPLVVGENLKLKGLGWQPEFSLAQGLQQMIAEANP